MNDAIDDGAWVRRCVARMSSLDPLLDPELARPIAEDMCGRPRWRDMGPELAAQTVFEIGSKPALDGV
jgi:hypothetical protein